MRSARLTSDICSISLNSGEDHTNRSSSTENKDDSKSEEMEEKKSVKKATSGRHAPILPDAHQDVAFRKVVENCNGLLECGVEPRELLFGVAIRPTDGRPPSAG